jgi:hypothetical protein
LGSCIDVFMDTRLTTSSVTNYTGPIRTQSVIVRKPMRLLVNRLEKPCQSPECRNAGIGNPTYAQEIITS